MNPYERAEFPMRPISFLMPLNLLSDRQSLSRAAVRNVSTGSPRNITYFFKI